MFNLNDLAENCGVTTSTVSPPEDRNLEGGGGRWAREEKAKTTNTAPQEGSQRPTKLRNPKAETTNVFGAI